jgi:hypothetical protein
MSAASRPGRAVDPRLEATWDWLSSSRDPAAELLLLRAGLAVPWGVGKAEASTALAADPVVVAAFAAQREDGSWGEADHAASLFSMRRKTLRRALKGRVDADAFAALGIDPGARPETLAPRQFADLARAARGPTS